MECLKHKEGSRICCATPKQKIQFDLMQWHKSSPKLVRVDREQEEQQGAAFGFQRLQHCSATTEYQIKL